MAGHLRVLTMATAGAATLAIAGAAHAGGGSSGSGSCGCVPTGHQVTIPGVTITPPTITVNTSSSSSSSASASAQASASAAVIANSAAAQTFYNTGGGSNYYIEQGATGMIPTLHVEGLETRRICTQMREVVKMTAVQAVCLDDKNVPHPASQVSPDRDIAQGYEGEIYRCIAGAHMQYTLGEFAGQARFDHGQTLTCAKGDALYYGAGGKLECRPQKPARDCNERSLLRRYGAGIKVLKTANRMCATWSGGAQQAEMSMVLDGGVGGVVH